MMDDWELTPTKSTSTVVLVGKAGNGKSATGNSIIGREAFESDMSPNGVTSTSDMQTVVLKDGRTVNVIDTPGLFDFSAGPEYVSKEIVKCINFAKDGIHAVLLVFSITSRFTREEEAAIESMKTFFGERIVDHMIIVFTGGDHFEKKGKTLQDYIRPSTCPEPLKNILKLCKNRVVLFNNDTMDKKKQRKQVDQLLSLVDSVMESNGGKPFSNEIFEEIKEGALKLRNKENEVEGMEGHSEQHLSEFTEQMRMLNEDQLRRIMEMVEQKLNTTIVCLQKQLDDEHEARLKAEKYAKEALKKSNAEIDRLMKKSNAEIEKLRVQLKMAEQERTQKQKCTIL